MIDPGGLKKKALKFWENGRFLRTWLRNETLFPLEIPFATPTGRRVMDDFTHVRDWIHALKAQSKPVKGFGYDIEFQPVNHRQLGPQQLPRRIFFPTAEDWLRFIGKTEAFKKFDDIVRHIRSRQPALMGFLEAKPMLALSHGPEWGPLLAVCAWFKAHPGPNLYLRQLDIQGVDTKFIENRKKILSELLDTVLEESAIDPSVTGLSKNGFERRFGLKYDPPVIRFRILDHRMAVCGLTDLSLPLSDFAALDLGAETVFVSENKINGLAFPPVTGAIIVFGMGYGIEQLAAIDWLREKPIYYWGDLDTHGFAILSQMRGYYPRTRSFLMDRKTLESHRELWGCEPKGKRFTGELKNLTPAEQHLFSALRENRYGHHLRLEQERIRFSHVQNALRTLCPDD